MARAHETQAAGEPAGVTGVRQAADEVRRAQHLERGEFKSVGAAERFARGQEPHPPRRKATLVGQARPELVRQERGLLVGVGLGRDGTDLPPTQAETFFPDRPGLWGGQSQ